MFSVRNTVNILFYFPETPILNLNSNFNLHKYLYCIPTVIQCKKLCTKLMDKTSDCGLL